MCRVFNFYNKQDAHYRIYNSPIMSRSRQWSSWITAIGLVRAWRAGHVPLWRHWGSNSHSHWSLVALLMTSPHLPHCHRHLPSQQHWHTDHCVLGAIPIQFVYSSFIYAILCFYTRMFAKRDHDVIYIESFFFAEFQHLKPADLCCLRILNIFSSEYKMQKRY